MQHVCCSVTRLCILNLSLWKITPSIKSIAAHSIGSIFNQLNLKPFTFRPCSSRCFPKQLTLKNIHIYIQHISRYTAVCRVQVDSDHVGHVQRRGFDTWGWFLSHGPHPFPLPRSPGMHRRQRGHGDLPGGAQRQHQPARQRGLDPPPRRRVLRIHGHSRVSGSTIG